MTAQELRTLLNEWDRLEGEGESYQLLIATPMGLFKIDEEAPLTLVNKDRNSLTIRAFKLYE